MTLQEYITLHLNKSFAWGENDCVTFVIGWLNIATGKNYLADYTPWTNASEAIQTVNKAGGLEKLFDENLQRINPRTAVDGDITLIGRTSFLFVGPDIVSVGENGLIFLNRMTTQCAWRY